MSDERIQLQTEAGKTIEAVLLSRSAEAIWVVIGGNFKCKLMPTRNGLAYAGSVMGREVLYERSVKEVRADLLREQQELARYRPR